MLEPAVITAGTLLVSAGLTGIVLRIARQTGVVDVPNERSSHRVPTPRGGGLAIVMAFMAALLVTYSEDAICSQVGLAFIAAFAVAAVGLVDDRRAVAPVVRLAVHFAAAAWALWLLGGIAPIPWGTRLIRLDEFGYVLGALALVWSVNLFNFMDGIDGLAAAEGAFIAAAGGVLHLIGGGAQGLATLCFACSASCLGFLLWNWTPARIFMGDVGSGFLGIVIATLALAAAKSAPQAIFVWLILGGVFFVDATCTFVRRVLRRERPSQAHRSHAYQWLSRRWKSHERVVISVLLINILWLLPWAVLAQFRPSISGMCALAALTPLVFLVLAIGAGRAESVGHSAL